MTPADEIKQAADRLRTARFSGAITATPVVAALLRARLPLADLLDDQADGDDEGEVNPWALAVARVLNGPQP